MRPAGRRSLGVAREHALSVLGWPELAHALATRCSSSSAAREAEELLPILDERAARLSLAETEERRKDREAYRQLQVNELWRVTAPDPSTKLTEEEKKLLGLESNVRISTG